MNKCSDPLAISLSQANRMLPLVRRIVVDILSLVDSLDTQNEQLRGIKELRERTSLDVGGAEIEDVRESIHSDQRRLNECVHELASLGVRLHDPIDGTVDFPGQLRGQAVAWCWRLGESSVSHWHRLDQERGSVDAPTCSVSAKIRHPIP